MQFTCLRLKRVTTSIWYRRVVYVSRGRVATKAVRPRDEKHPSSLPVGVDHGVVRRHPPRPLRKRLFRLRPHYHVLGQERPLVVGGRRDSET